MTQPMGMADFFALEAGDYLERLDGLLQGAGAPAIEEFVRLARALRGSALMASHTAIARVAAGLETVARSVREGRLTWDAGTRQLATRAVDDLKVFVRRAGTWSEADGAKADALAAQLERSGGRPSAPVRTAAAHGLDAGARAFVAREGAAIASALDRAAQALRANPQAQDPLQTVLRALQPLRGLAALADLPPLPDLLDGIERAIGELVRASEPVAEAGELFAAAARAIAQSAREVAERGRPDPEGADFRRFAERLMRLLDAEAPAASFRVVPIESLFHRDPGPHVVQRGTPPARPALGRTELVTQGEHLRQAADSLERAPSATQRELRAHTLAGTFRALGNVGGGVLADALARFANAARETVTSGAATRDPAALAAQLRRVGELLGEANTADEAALAAGLDAITAGLGSQVQPLQLGVSATGTSLVPPVPLSANASSPPVPLSANAEGGNDTPPETPDLTGSWATYQRLVAAGIGAPSLAELLSGVNALKESNVVDIRVLLFRGDRALARARELRAEAHQAGTPERLREILDELSDLVALAFEPSA